MDLTGGLEARVRNASGNVFATTLPDLLKKVDPSFSGRRPREYYDRPLTRREWREMCECLVPFAQRRPCVHLIAHFLQYGRAGRVPPIPDFRALFDRRFFYKSWRELWESVGSVLPPAELLDGAKEAEYLSHVDEGQVQERPLFLLAVDHRAPSVRAATDAGGTSAGLDAAEDAEDADGGSESTGRSPGPRMHNWGSRSNRRRLSVGELPRHGSTIARVNNDVSKELALRANELKRFGSLGALGAVS